MGEAMTWLQAVILGLVQGLTEFLPISSSGHLRIVSEIFFGSDAGASFTAVTQLGTELAVLIYFARDIVRIITAWFRGVFNAEHRGDLDYRMAGTSSSAPSRSASSGSSSKTRSVPAHAICG